MNFKTPFLLFSCLLLALSFGFSACKTSKNTVTSVNNHPKAATGGGTASSQHDSAVVTISRSPCYGKCPVYSMIIYPNGSVWFEGQRNVTKVGRYNKNIGEDSVKVLINTFNAADVWDMKDTYPPVATDLPWTSLTFRDNGKYKAIKGTFNAPQSLIDIVQQLFNIADDDNGWLKTGDLPMQK